MMKHSIIIFILLLTGFRCAFAQDIISLKSGAEIKARIIRLNTDNVTFVTESNTDTLSMLRSEITKLQYRSGITIFLSKNEIPVFGTEPTNDSLFFLGEKDASRYYKGYKAAATGTLITSLFIPLGLIPAIACSATPPANENLDYRDPKLMQNPSYYNGYSEKAFKIKKKKVWTNFGIGTGITLGYFLLITVASGAVLMM